jgi:indolepyruvate ferredoxin oxidoreductase alpha subunit
MKSLLGKRGQLKLLTGNEAIARGAYEAGVRVATAYPGTPSTEILESIASYKEIYSQWSINEKVALEVASGASYGGARTLVAMKHVGLNVAADPFMTLSYTGINAGLVVVSADDPGMYSSQNEQDNRYYSRFSKVLMLEPSDSQEAKDFVIEAFDISERFDTPVMLRITTRISHSRSVVSIGGRTEHKDRKYKKDCQKYVMIPAFGRIRHKALLKRWKELVKFSEQSSLNCLYAPKTKNDKPLSIGIITSGVSFQYAREIFENTPILKLGITNPIPYKIISDFARDKKMLIIVEELEPFIEEQIRQMCLGIKIAGKDYFPQYGELSPEILEDFYRQLFGTDLISKQQSKETGTGIDDFKNIPGNHENKNQSSDRIPNRPPVLCAGCPHRSVFYILKKLRLKVMGDIGCYTLSVLPPLNSLDSCLCMGAGIGQALGMEKADPEVRGEIVSVIGDSTFFHSGITPLVDSIYNKGSGVIIILDNRITAMTGHQVHPGVGVTLMGEDTTEIKAEEIARGAGVKNIRVVDPNRIDLFEKTVREELKKGQLSVIIARRKCVLLEKGKKQANVYINEEKCEKCGLCLKFGCPAIELREDTYSINEIMCTGCGVCVDICKKNAIKIK